MIDLGLLITKAREMTPFPASTVRLTQMVASQHCDISDVAAVAAYDEVLTMKLLRAANSAVYARENPISTPYEAIAFLGTTLVLDLAVASAVRPSFQGRVPGYGLDEGTLWRHSVAAATAAEAAAGFCSVEMPAEAFTASLLHDVGKVVMGRFLSPDVLRFIALARQAEHYTQIEAETQILGVHHGELGGLIAQHWQLPERIVQGIIYHHDPEHGSDIVCDFAYLANETAKQIDGGRPGHAFDLTLPAGVASRLGIDPDRLDAFCSAAAARFTQVSQCYNAL